MTDPAASSLDRRLVLTTRGAWAAAAIVAIVAGSLGPWATVGIFSTAGTAGDGTVTLVAAVVAIPLTFARRAWPAVGLVALAVLAVVIVDGAQILREGNDVIDPHLGWGMIVLALGGVSLAAWVAAAAARSSRIAGVIVGVVMVVAVAGGTVAEAAHHVTRPVPAGERGSRFCGNHDYRGWTSGSSGNFQIVALTAENASCAVARRVAVHASPGYGFDGWSCGRGALRHAVTCTKATATLRFTSGWS